MKIKTVLVFLGAVALAASAAAQTKASGIAHCKSEPPAPVAIGDTAGHAFAIGKSQCTWTKMEIAGVPYKDGVSVSLEEIDGDKWTSTGYHIATLANGDKATARFQGTATTKDGKLLTRAAPGRFRAAPGSARGSRAREPSRARPTPTGPCRSRSTASTRCRRST